MLEHVEEGARRDPLIAVHGARRRGLHQRDAVPPEVLYRRSESRRLVEQRQSPLRLGLLEHQAQRVPRHRACRGVPRGVGDAHRLFGSVHPGLRIAQRRMAYRDVEQCPHQPDRILVGAGPARLADVVRQGRGLVALVECDVGEHVGGIRDPTRAPDGEPAPGARRERPRRREVATIPRAPRGHSGGGRKQRVVGVGEFEGAFRPARGFVTDAQVRQFRERRHQPQRKVCTRSLVRSARVERRTLECRAQIVVIGKYPLHPRLLVGAVHLDGGAHGQIREVLRVAPRVELVDSLVLQQFPSISPHGLQHQVARPIRTAAHGHHGLVDQTGQQIQRVVLGGSRPAAHPVCGFQVESACEDGEPDEQVLFGCGEQLIGPLDRRSQTLVPRQCPAHATREQPHPAIEATGEVQAAHHPHAGGRQFDRERQSVETSADRRHRTDGFALEIEVGPARPGPVLEQRGCIVGGKGCQRQHPFPFDAERLPTGREHRHRRTVRHDLRDEPRRTLQHVLAVVHDEDQPARLEVLDDGALDVETVALLQPKRRCDGIADRPPVVQRSEFAHPGTVLEAVLNSPDDLGRQP